MAILVKLETTTTSSREIPFRWHLCETRMAADEWVKERQEEVDQFNASPGAVAWRGVYAEFYDEARQKELTLDDVRFIPLPMLAALLTAA